MIPLGKRGVRFGLAVLGAGTMFGAAPALAQTAATTGAFTERPQAALSRNLRTLAANPKSATALMGAGKAALDLGDPQAALTFFARAEEQMPRDGRIKMWIGSALVQLQQAHAALKFFRDATDLGVPGAEVARDRGLAQDIAGNPREAQRDYRLVLQRGRDDEVTRRLALSLAISGEREAALRLIEDQLLVRDRAAERTRALVLALTGDSAGAARAVQAAMPGPQANAMAPFLARLPSLSPAERALAVHLGVFPQDGRTAALSTYAANDFANSVTNAGRPDGNQKSLARRTPLAEPVSTAQRRRPGTEDTLAAAVRRASPPPAKPRTEEAVAEAPARTTTGRSSGSAGFGGANPEGAWSLVPGGTRREPELKPKPTEPVSRTEIAAAPSTALPTPTRIEAKPEALTAAAPPPVSAEPVPVPVAEASPPPSPQTGAEAQPAQTGLAAAELSAPPPQAEAVPAGSRLADLSATLAEIAEPEPAPTAAKAKPAASKPPTARIPTPAAAKKPKPAPADPSRVWVQVAGGADKGALPREYARLKAKAPKLLGGRIAWTSPLSATNRLLVGPFASAKEAQAFVNQLKAQDLSGFAWTSAAGQKVEKLTAK